MEQATGRAQDKRDRDQEENMEANWLAGHFQDAQALVSKGRKQNDPCVSAKAVSYTHLTLPTKA